MGVIEKTIHNMTELDAAGWAIITLRCENEADIRRTVEGYVHAKSYEPKYTTKTSPQNNHPTNIKEVTGMGTVKTISKPFVWTEHAPSSGDDGALDYGAEPALMNYLLKCVDPISRMEHRLLYIPYLYDIIGNPERADRSAIQLQYLYLLREIGVQKKLGLSNALIVIGCMDGILCSELREHTYVLDIDYPDKEELLQIIRQTCRECAGMASGLEPSIANELAEALRGMRKDEIVSIINLAYAQSENPLEHHAKSLFDAAKKAKKQRIAGVRGLKWIDTDSAGEVGGLEALQRWIRTKSKTFLYPHAALLQKAVAPKGVLLAGLPGCGKTHLAKYTSRLLSSSESSVPLLQLDLSSMLGKWLGEAEANCEMALRAVEGVAPCVLLIDEIEKVFGGVTDGGSSDAMMHIFSSFLDWMQKEREKPILVIATANKTERLPPELKRKGRFDETFFTGIPTASDCKAILRIHLKKKMSVMAGSVDIDGIAEELLSVAAHNRRFMNGADIETIINAAFCTLFAELKDSDISAAEADNARAKLYSSDDVKTALKNELISTRSYFDNNLEGVARYWIEMNVLDFRDASDKLILPNNNFNRQTGMFTGIEGFSTNSPKDYEKQTKTLAEKFATEGNYDKALQFTLMREIFRQVQRAGGIHHDTK